MLLYHASPVEGIKTLEPRVSNHGKPLLYFSDRRENTLVYLCNAVEKFCREQGIVPDGPYQKWGSYGFTPEGILRLDEYWPGATEETYGGAAGYIYTVETDIAAPLEDIPHAWTADRSLPVTGCEFVPDAMAAMRKAAEESKMTLTFYKNNSEKMLKWIETAIQKELTETPDEAYRQFLRAKFPSVQ